MPAGNSGRHVKNHRVWVYFGQSKGFSNDLDAGHEKGMDNMNVLC